MYIFFFYLKRLVTNIVAYRDRVSCVSATLEWAKEVAGAREVAKRPARAAR